MKIFAIVITCMLASIAGLWLYMDPGFDSIVAFLAAVSALAGLLITTKNKYNSMSQSVGDNSTAVQARGDIKIDCINTGDKK
ncbi:hypothetical protein ACV23D_001316 [Escherichia coli]|jgi:hypothetical protein|uniref:hypothetical protein n=1 Tax=Enterobacteriaceae TaxID=543 RepID=UPI0001B527CD|nr:MULTISPECIES: hypothetical protein [Enterobacteriaceae]EEZ5782049.1 hypothetical protein [Escherichia coli O40]DAL68807.1 MAG TPA: Renin receptor-like protein [Caudoviricetes sp.]EAB0388598.1 hypothetical protein [Escherichia coli]EER8327395.1 hypothetical protein [Escherichia coli]EEW8249739.1 hypothetical protein [Escherichia coli]